jgi:hypothetical protein
MNTNISCIHIDKRFSEMHFFKKNFTIKLNDICNKMYTFRCLDK